MTAPGGVIWRVYGLHVRSPWPLSPSRSAAAAPDLTIELLTPRASPAEGLPGQVLGESRVEGRLREGAYAADGRVSLVYPGYLVARFDLERAVCELQPDPAADPAVVQRLVAGPVLATWMILNDLPMLHASAVQIGSGAVVFVGNSGSGKSTIAAALVGAGAVAITDDVCRLAEHDGVWVCYPDAGQLRLRNESAALASMFHEEAATSTEDRTTLCVPTTTDPVPVAAAVFPRIADDVTEPVATRLRGARAVVALLERPRMASLLGHDVSAALFRFGSSLAATVPTWELAVPRATVTPRLAADLLATVSGMLAEP